MLKEADLITRSIVTSILKQNLGERVNLVKCYCIIKQQGITHHIENRASQGHSAIIFKLI